MKISSTPPRLSALLGSALLMVLVSQAAAQDRFYNPSLPGSAVWDATNYWSSTAFSGPFDTTWTQGGTAKFNFAGSHSIEVNDDFELGRFENLNINTSHLLTLSSASTVRTLTFSGGTMLAGGRTIFGSNVNLAGNFTLSGGYLVLEGSTGVSAYNGTARITSGGQGYTFLNISNVNRVNENSHFIIDLPDATPNLHNIMWRRSGNFSSGNLTLNSGVVYIGQDGGLATLASTNLTVTRLAGTGGRITISRGLAGTDYNINRFIVNQADNTTYSGDIIGRDLQVEGHHKYLRFGKAGSGALTLNGQISLLQGTEVTGGTLYINDSAKLKEFANLNGLNSMTAAIRVANGATLGGTGTFSVLAGGTVVVEDGGQLSAGIRNEVGTTTYELKDNGLLDLTAAAGASSPWLYFDLGSDSSAGITYDQIVITDGRLDIGTGLLGFNDFAFNLLGDFAPGSYTLIQGNNVIGSLGADTFGSLSGYDASLSLESGQIVLHVIPEPNVHHLFSIFAIGLVGVSLYRRKMHPVKIVL